MRETWKRPAYLAGLLVAGTLGGLVMGAVRTGPEPAESKQVPYIEPKPLQYPELETDAAFAGTWQLVEKTGDQGGTKLGDQIIVEERIVDRGPTKGATVWDWHQPGPSPILLTHRSQFVSWGPVRTPAMPWPIIELKRGPSMRFSGAKAIYQLRGDLLRLAFMTPDQQLPADFKTGDVEIWRRIAPPVTRLEPESLLDGRWRLASVTFHGYGSFGPAANAKVPEHLVGTTKPDWFLKAKEGTVFDVKNGVWHEAKGAAGNLAWTVSRELRLPHPLYIRKMADPRPPGVPAENVASYRVSAGELILQFPQTYISTHADGVPYLDTGERIETYTRLGLNVPGAEKRTEGSNRPSEP